MLNLLMKDDRVPLVLTDLDSEFQIALLQIHTLPPEVWSVLEATVGVLVQGLRSGAMSASLASTCFSMWRIHRARLPPFIL